MGKPEGRIICGKNIIYDHMKSQNIELHNIDISKELLYSVEQHKQGITLL